MESIFWRRLQFRGIELKCYWDRTFTVAFVAVDDLLDIDIPRLGESITIVGECDGTVKHVKIVRNNMEISLAPSSVEQRLERGHP